MAKHKKSNNNHGGPRLGAGRPPVIKTEIKTEGGTARRTLDMHGMMQVMQVSEAHARRKVQERINPFQLPAFPPQAVPPEHLRMAMDSSLAWAGDQASAIISNFQAEGMLFPGYAYLSELAQRPEYRVLAETIPDDATRKWIKFEIAGDEDETKKRQAEDAEDPEGAEGRRESRLKDAGKEDKVKKIEEYLQMLRARERLYDLMVGDNLMGRMHLFFGFSENGSGDPAELRTSIGDGMDRISHAKVSPSNPLRTLKTVEPVWTYPMAYNALDPLAEDWYNPQYWYVLGKEIHVSRIIPFVTRPVPDILKPSYAFGGLSMTQLAEPYVNNWLRTRQSVGEMIHSFSVMALSTNLSAIMQPGGAQDLMTRMALFNTLRDNQGLFAFDKSSEDLKNISAPLGGLSDLQAQSLEHLSTVSRLPLVKVTGIAPKGLNASSEGEIQVYDDTVAAFQERKGRPVVSKIINFIQLSLWGAIDPQITFIFEPLRQMTAKEEADLQKAKAERDNIFVQGGAISAEEWRGSIINDPALPYADLDPDDVPEPPDDGLGEPGEGGDDPGGGGDTPPNPSATAKRPKPQEGGSAEDADPFGLDAEWKESDHPRAPDGKFGSGGGGSSSGGGASKTSPITAGKKALSPKTLTKVGEKMGSNDGGTFVDESTGKKFYIKKPASPAHVTNELLGAKLYQMAGGKTLDYHPVEGGKHVATEIANLDVNNVNKFTPAEKKQAQKDFAVQAWIGNWDAAGTGGDNKGILNGKPTALDFGGALEYRAQGEPKGEAFGKSVTELGTMLNPEKSPDNANLYGSMTDAEKVASAKQVTDLTNDEIITAVKEAGGTATLAQKLIDRKAYIAGYYNLETDNSEWDDGKHPRNPDGTFAKGTGGEEPTEAEQTAAENSEFAQKLIKEAEAHNAATAAAGTPPEDDDVPKPGAYAGQYITTGSSPKENHALTTAKVLKQPSQIGIHYRRLLAKLIKDGSDKYGHSQDVQDKLKALLLKSLQDSHANAVKKGKGAEATKLASVIAKMGGEAPAAPNKKELDLSDLEGGKENHPFYEQQVQQFSPKFYDAASKIAEEQHPTPSSALLKAQAAIKAGDATALALEYMLTPAEKTWAEATYGTIDNAYKAAQKLVAKQTESSATATSEAESKKKADLKNAFKDKYTANIANMASEKTPANLAKQMVKAAVQTGLPFGELTGSLSDEHKQLLTAQYGSVETAYKKAVAYSVAEQEQSVAAKQAETKAQTLAQKQATASKAALSAALQKKADLDKKLKAMSNPAEALKDMLGSSAETYKNKAQQKINAIGYQKYITGEQAVPILAYTGSHYDDLNSQLRQGVMETDQYVFHKTLSDALDRLPSHEGVVYRKASIPAEVFATYQPGKIVEERGFTSSAKHSGVWYGSYHYEIHSKTGKDVSKLSVQGTSEAEVLFKAGSRFFVEKVEGNKIVMHEV